MPISPIRAGAFVTLSSHPSKICYVDQVSDNGHINIVKSNGDIERVMHVESFFDKEQKIAMLTFCALCLGFAFKKIMGKEIANSIGRDMNKLEDNKLFIARAIIKCNEIDPIITHRATSPYYDQAMEMSRNIILEHDNEIKQKKENAIKDAEKIKMESKKDDEASVEELKNNIVELKLAPEIKNDIWEKEAPMIEDSLPPRESEDATKKDIGYLREGVCPSLKKRHFYCGIFKIKDGTIIDVKTYQDTGYGTFEPDKIWGIHNALILKEGKYASFYLHDDKKAYIRWFNYPFQEIPFKSIRKLQRQFTLREDRNYEFEIWCENDPIKNKNKRCARIDII